MNPDNSPERMVSGTGGLIDALADASSTPTSRARSNRNCWNSNASSTSASPSARTRPTPSAACSPAAGSSRRSSCRTRKATVPKKVNTKTAKQRAVFAKAFNATLKRTGSEERAFTGANAAAAKVGTTKD